MPIYGIVNIFQADITVRKEFSTVPLALLSALKVLKKSPLGNSRVVPQKDRRQQDARRQEWRGGRRVSDFSQFTNTGWVTPTTGTEARRPATEGYLH